MKFQLKALDDLRFLGIMRVTTRSAHARAHVHAALGARVRACAVKLVSKLVYTGPSPRSCICVLKVVDKPQYEIEILPVHAGLLLTVLPGLRARRSRRRPPLSFTATSASDSSHLRGRGPSGTNRAVVVVLEHALSP